ncbi:hypothetical protein COBT_000945 [Conglomerata obtusa]
MPYLDSYIVALDVENSDVSLGDSDNATLFNYAWDTYETKNYFITLENNNNYALHVNSKANKITSKKLEKTDLDRFDIVPQEINLHHYWIQNFGKCFTWVESLSLFVLEECSVNDPLQKFEMKVLDLDGSQLGTSIIGSNEPEKQTVHLTQLFDNNKKRLNLLLDLDKIGTLTFSQMEKNANEYIRYIYKLIYDLTICFVDKRVCTKGGMAVKAYKYKSKYASTKSFSASASASSSSKSSSSGSASASAGSIYK